MFDPLGVLDADCNALMERVTLRQVGRRLVVGHRRGSSSYTRSQYSAIKALRSS
jgi:hypothetical protein